MSGNILSWIFGAGVLQGIFLVAALASLKVRNRDARWLLAASIGVFTVMLGEEFLDTAGAPIGVGIGLLAEFAVGPLLLLFVVALAEDDPTPIARKWPHFIPFFLAAVWLAYLNLAFEPRWVSLSNPAMRALVTGTVLVKFVYFAAYATLILRRPLSLASKPEASRRALAWVRAFLWLFCAAYAFAALSFLAFYLRPDWAIDSDLVGGLILTASIYALGYFAIARRDVLDVRMGRVDEAAGAEDARLAERALAHLSASREFANPDLGLRDLAAAMGASEARLSRALNARFPGGFYALVNDLRLDAFRGLCADPAADKHNILTLALEAGFGSKATFYRFFKAREGATPTAYRDRIRRERLGRRFETPVGAASVPTK